LDQAAAYRADLDPAGALAGLVPHWTRSSAPGRTRWRIHAIWDRSDFMS